MPEATYAKLTLLNTISKRLILFFSLVYLNARWRMMGLLEISRIRSYLHPLPDPDPHLGLADPDPEIVFS